MDKTERQKQTIKIVTIAVIAIVILLLVILVYQWIKIGVLNKNQAELDAENIEQEQKIQQVQDEYDYCESQEYVDSYLKNEKNYGNAGDVIFD